MGQVALGGNGRNPTKVKAEGMDGHQTSCIQSIRIHEPRTAKAERQSESLSARATATGRWLRLPQERTCAAVESTESKACAPSEST